MQNRNNINLKEAKIVIVEDDESHRELLSRLFSRNNVLNDVLLLDSGVALLKFLENYTDNPKELIILLDLNLPLLDGYQVLEKIREVYSPHELMVIMISTTARENDINLAYKKGCNYFLRKPLDFRLLEEFTNKNNLSIIKLKYLESV